MSREPRRPKGYRSLVVDGSTFFWLLIIRSGRCCCDYHCYCGCGSNEPATRQLSLIKAGHPGKLKVDLRFGHREQVTPGDVEYLIRSATQGGWDPKARGQTRHGPIEASSIPSARRLEAAQLRIVEEIMLL